MIKTFKCADTKALYEGKNPRAFSSIRNVAARKLTQLATVTRLEDLRVPPGNHLEALKGDRRGQHSIRVNDQFRVCFKWQGSDAYEVEITDYH